MCDDEILKRRRCKCDTSSAELCCAWRGRSGACRRRPRTCVTHASTQLSCCRTERSRWCDSAWYGAQRTTQILKRGRALRTRRVCLCDRCLRDRPSTLSLTRTLSYGYFWVFIVDKACIVVILRCWRRVIQSFLSLYAKQDMAVVITKLRSTLNVWIQFN